MVMDVEHLTDEKRQRELGLFSSENKGLGASHQYPRISDGGGKEDGARLFPMVPIDRTKGNGHKLNHRMSLLNISEHHFFTVKVTEDWHILPREVVESPGLEIFKT
ncbi:hypothetical protein llap_1948 [Limosa lapponica baueri]|uniref:Uncharacterized protein n=1 Tax=Limosa lapponica baueri TaxID=1758121 RepID=A0A2I0UNW3_LIMLA|nr:hypothetical protein llap_1948 [Limosa lapponica baueri]